MATDFRRGPTTAQPVAPFLDRSLGILALGGLLIVVNFLTNEGAPLVSAIATGSTPTLAAQQAAPAATKTLVLQGLMLGILFVLAKLDEDAGSFGLTFVLALWGLWLFNHFPSGSAPKEAAPGKTG